MFLESKVCLACKADNLSAICEPTVWKMWGLHISQTYRLPQPVIGITLGIACADMSVWLMTFCIVDFKLVTMYAATVFVPHIF
jgi:hypothetical protein